MVTVDISGVLGGRSLLGEAHSSWSRLTSLVFSVEWSLLSDAHSSWSQLTSLVFSVDGHFSVEPIRHGHG